jgi:predicted ribonuclease YlaK
MLASVRPADPAPDLEAAALPAGDDRLRHRDLHRPAGTGKTYLAVAMAAAYLLEKKVRRIVLARPAVEAGEKLGFLPGDLVEKVNPYLRPLYDALYDIIGYEKVGKDARAGDHRGGADRLHARPDA